MNVVCMCACVSGCVCLPRGIMVIFDKLHVAYIRPLRYVQSTANMTSSVEREVLKPSQRQRTVHKGRVCSRTDIQTDRQTCSSHGVNIKCLSCRRWTRATVYVTMLSEILSTTSWLSSKNTWLTRTDRASLSPTVTFHSVACSSVHLTSVASVGDGQACHVPCYSRRSADV